MQKIRKLKTIGGSFLSTG